MRDRGHTDMMQVFYGSIFAAALLCSAIYLCNWHKRFNVNISMIFTFIPIACMGHFLYSVSENVGEAVTAQKIIYLGSSFLQLFILLSIMNLCRIEIRKWIRTLLFVICTAAFAGALTIGYADFFYRNISFDSAGGVSVLNRDYGWMHTVYYVVVIDFGKADAIIMEGMGTQFDPGLKRAYVQARPRLEEYYGRLSDR